LAKASDIYVDEDDFIAVDEYMRTHESDVYAVGDCAQKRDFVTRRRVATMLASTHVLKPGCRHEPLNLTLSKLSAEPLPYIQQQSVKLVLERLESPNRSIAGRLRCCDRICSKCDRHPGSLPGSHKQT
jgi:hypothetical protein